ncbi:hypothetical protein M231_01150 [Tremella mesenterica]|uniref:Uncharacterized protein n=1 Tax=Tremella mesenterica TaxID=5217 RepID=A0A4Q1BUF0_TREME|nr:hypothetical protein M231_01150 [Tremella mesenterica]
MSKETPGTTTPKPDIAERKIPWSLPSRLLPRSVSPDFSEPRLETIGIATDPGRMSIYLCLIDSKPFLLPSLFALHKHRKMVHDIPIPEEPTKTLPLPLPLPLSSLSQNRTSSIEHSTSTNPTIIVQQDAMIPHITTHDDPSETSNDILRDRLSTSTILDSTSISPSLVGVEKLTTGSNFTHSSVSEKVDGLIPHNPDPPLERPTGEQNVEWITWKFTPEEESRRRAYLPLA